MTAREPDRPIVAIVEDDAAVRESLTMLVEAVGYRAQPFASAAEFLGRDDRARPDCLILDVRLAGMSGVELHEQLVRGGMNPPTIFLSGHEPFEVSAEARRQGVVAVFEKPCSPDRLVDAIARALG